MDETYNAIKSSIEKLNKNCQYIVYLRFKLQLKHKNYTITLSHPRILELIRK